MKSINLILIYLCTLVAFYFLLSLIGMLWIPYNEVISTVGWAMFYLLFIGWWIALLPANEYYSNNKDYFNKL